MRRSSRFVVAPLALGAVVTLGSAPGCYGPTEIRVAVTTDADCQSRVTTQIFTAPTGTLDFGGAPAAETTECGSVEPRIGTLSVVPSGARDDQFDLQVVGAVGVPASDCRSFTVGAGAAGAGAAAGASATTGCIVARRRVSFRPHKSLTVPVLLSARCIGVTCSIDQTCDLGTCTSTTDCTDSGCPRERAAGAGGAGDAGGVDGTGGGDAAAGGDAALDARDGSGSARCGATPELVADGQSVNGQLAMDGADLVYANIKGAQGSEIRRVPRSGGQLPTGQSVPNLMSVTASNGTLGWTLDVNGNGNLGFTVRPPGGLPVVLAPPVPCDPAHDALAFAAGRLVGIAQPKTGQPHAFAVSGTSGTVAFETQSVTGTATEIVVDDLQDFYAVTNGDTIVHYSVDVSSGAPVQVGHITTSGSPQLTSDIAVASGFLFVATTATPQNKGSIHRIARAAISGPFTGTPWLDNVNPQSMASDGTALYYLAGTALWKTVITASGPSPVQLDTVGPNAVSLQVDDQCVYWVDTGGARIMKRAK